MAACHWHFTQSDLKKHQTDNPRAKGTLKTTKQWVKNRTARPHLNEFYRKLGAMPFKEFAEKIYALKPNENKDFREMFKPMKDELTEYLNNKYKGKFKEEEE